MELHSMQQLIFFFAFVIFINNIDFIWIFFLSTFLQHKLEGALLALGQFQHALDELLTWLTHTEGLLSEQKPVGGDPKAIEIELAKHHVCSSPCVLFLYAFLVSSDCFLVHFLFMCFSSL